MLTLGNSVHWKLKLTSRSYFTSEELDNQTGAFVLNQEINFFNRTNWLNEFKKLSDLI